MSDALEHARRYQFDLGTLWDAAFHDHSAKSRMHIQLRKLRYRERKPRQLGCELVRFRYTVDTGEQGADIS